MRACTEGWEGQQGKINKLNKIINKMQTILQIQTKRVIAKEYRTSFLDDKNIIKWYSGDGCITLWI